MAVCLQLILSGYLSEAGHLWLILSGCSSVADLVWLFVSSGCSSHQAVTLIGQKLPLVRLFVCSCLSAGICLQLMIQTNDNASRLARLVATVVATILAVVSIHASVLLSDLCK